MPIPEDLPLSEDQINNEKRYIHVTDNGNAIEYLFECSFSRSKTISFTPNDQHRQLTVATGISGPPTHSDATDAEMRLFMQVATHALPESPLTMQLCQFIQTQADNLSEDATRAIYSLKKRNLPSPT